MKGKRSVWAVSVLTVLLVGVAPAWAATWYVDGINGADPNDGLTPATAVQTIQVAIDRAAVEGDTVQVMAAPGHAYGPITFTNSPAGKQVKVIGAGPDVTRLTGSGTGSTVDGVTVETNAWGYVSGFTIEAWENGVVLRDGATMTVTNCVVANNTVDGIHAWVVGWNLNMTNNTVVANGGDGVALAEIAGPNATAGLANNIIVSNLKYGLHTDASNGYSFGLSDVYSIYWNNVAGNTSISGDTARTSFNVVSVSPSFVDTDVGNYHLLASSPAIDAGRPGAADMDPDGTRNNMGVWGGPGAALFWDDPAGGPVITTLVVTPSSVPQGGTISIEATAEIRSP